jgi:hypothetical protein
MKVTLMVRWKIGEILTIAEFEKKINDKIESYMHDDEMYAEFLYDYLENNGIAEEFFKALDKNNAEDRKLLENIHAEVAKTIRAHVEERFKEKYHATTIEI